MSGAPLRAVIMTRPGTFVLLSGKPTEYRKTADTSFQDQRRLRRSRDRSG